MTDQVFSAALGLIGALVGGVLSGGAVLLQYKSETKRRIQDELAIEANRLVMIVPYVTTAMTQSAGLRESILNKGSKAWEAQQEVTESLTKIDFLTRRKPKAYEKVRKEMDMLSAQLQAALDLYVTQGRPLSMEDLVYITPNRLVSAIVGERDTLENLVSKFKQEGFRLSDDSE